MGTDHHIPNIDIEHGTAGSAAEEQLGAFTAHSAANLGPTDVVWNARPDIPETY
ncbi:hypothetical protein [Arthrobacter crystallopoietes]|uniref:Uncharacterized protein n=1 Tax=Crystallibacter crystallopoietes TaxID=37928 RepID=A0A1H0XKV9_9MICC|nr:hypothetical protein [Arthrobacter crystallopoietes]SDQ03483.1 hypothetical protein SAMN04489742_0096 [Arthrobacter crystallopoietes]